MHLFQSDNIWKRQARARRQAEHPPTPYEAWRSKLCSDSVWLAGGVLVLALYLQAITTGRFSPTLTNLVVVAVVALYCLFSGVQIGRHWRSRPAPSAPKKSADPRRKNKP